MTILITWDWAVYFYWFLESYFYVRVEEIKVLHYPVDDDYSYSGEDCTNFAEVIPISAAKHRVNAEEEPLILKSALNEESEELFMQIEKEITAAEEGDIYHHSYKTGELLLDGLRQESDQEEIFVSEWIEDDDQDEDCIHMNDLMIEQTTPSQNGFESFASAKIMDCLEGAQQWVVSVVGIEENYIHISDGKRLWVNVGEKAKKIGNGDILILDVVRAGKEISVQNLVRVEASVSEEYMIPDEEHLIQYDRALAM